MKKLIIGLVRFYQWALSPYFGGMCCYSPSCSQYMIEVIKECGAARGVLKGAGRLLHCHPWKNEL